MLRVMTANLLNGAGSPAMLEELLNRFQPDVMGAQELSVNQAEVMERHFSFGVVKPQDDNEGKGLMSQREMYPDLLPLPYRDALTATIDVDGASVDIVSLHIANPIDGRYGSLHHRRRQIKAIVPRLTVPGRRILMGDLNSTPAWPAYRRLRRHMDDSVADWSQSNSVRPQRTWAYRPNWLPMLRIDHVFTTGLAATVVNVLKIQGSDHRALIVDLELS
jgi:endonuclease/exonuclease/phosphatase family metal-dependent hydrolase